MSGGYNPNEMHYNDAAVGLSNSSDRYMEEQSVEASTVHLASYSENETRDNSQMVSPSKDDVVAEVEEESYNNLESVHTETFENEVENEDQDMEEEEEELEKDHSVDDQNEEYLAEVGDMNCYCVPFYVSGFRDFLSRTKAWTFLNKEQIFSAITVAMAQIPEVVSSALISGVHPKFALHSAWIANVVTAFTGGRPGMISGPTFFMGVALIDLVEKDGVGYVFYAVLFAGLLQTLFGLLGFGALMRMIPYPVMQGFTNAMVLIIGAAQFRYGRVDPYTEVTNDPDRRLIAFGKSWEHITDNRSSWVENWPLIILSLHAVVAFTISWIMPRITRAIPGPIIAMLFGSLFEHLVIRKVTDTRSATIRNYADIEVSYARPFFNYDDVHVPGFGWETFQKVYVAGLTIFGASIVESLLTSQYLDEITEIKGVRNRVALGQGLSNVLCSTFGGMPSSGSLSQSILATHTDGITTLSTGLTGGFIYLFIGVAHSLVDNIPLGSMAGVIFWVLFKMFDWAALFSSIAAVLPLTIRDRIHLDCKISRADTLIMLTVMALTVCWDSTVAILIGVLIAVVVYAWDSSNRVVVEREVTEDDITSVTYNVSGPLFFATAQSFIDIFPMDDIQYDPDEVVILLEGAEIFDSSGMIAVKRIYDRFVEAGKVVALSTLSPTSRRLMEKCAVMWQGVNFLEIEEIDDDEEIGEMKSVDQIESYASNSIDEN